MNILVIGATGVLGRNVAPRLIERGHAVRAVVRRREQAQFLQHTGAEPTVGDIFDRNSLDDAARGCDVALHLATAVPKSGVQDWSLNDRVRREGTRNFIAAATSHGVKRYIQQSITLLYGDNGQAIVNESAPTQPTPVSQSAADMEDIVRASALEWCILRGGLFYGAGTGRDDEWRQAAWQGRLMLPHDGSDLISLVHVVDMARAVVTATENAPSGSVYNIVDDEPVSYKRLFTHVAAQLNTAAPQAGGPKFLPSLGCSNAKIKQELSWQPSYPSYRSGLA
ncbi:MAG TPA: NAD(P)H-binding protein [Anaerolineae bacterium]|nr:NAD(P)H-binding protein [Anaerolineae bacterium]